MPPSTVDSSEVPPPRTATGSPRSAASASAAITSSREAQRAIADGRASTIALNVLRCRSKPASSGPISLEHSGASVSGGRSCTARYASLIALWVYANASESELAIATLRNGWRPAYCGWPSTGPYSDGSNVDVSSCA